MIAIESKPKQLFMGYRCRTFRIPLAHNLRGQYIDSASIPGPCCRLSLMVAQFTPFILRPVIFFPCSRRKVESPVANPFMMTVSLAPESVRPLPSLRYSSNQVFSTSSNGRLMSSTLLLALIVPVESTRTKLMSFSKRFWWMNSPCSREKKKASVIFERHKLKKNASRTLIDTMLGETV